MKLKIATLILVSATILSGCHQGHFYPEMPVPKATVGSDVQPGWQPYQASGSRPYGASEAPRQTDQWQQYPRPTPRPVTREPLPAPTVTPRQPASQPADSAFERAQPKAPPTNLNDRKRTYSSRPDKNASLNNLDRSAFQASAKPAVIANQSYVRSPWADKAIRPDNRASFDTMVKSAARLGKGSYEDEAGRIYLGEHKGTEGGCDRVEITVKANDGTPVVSKGTAYSC
jgi:hypothetical protein